MFELLTEQAREVLRDARREAVAMHGSCVDGEHLLLALVGEHGGIAAQALSRAGLDPERVRGKVLERVAPGDARSVGPVPFTDGAKAVLDAAHRESTRRELKFIGTEHLLLGLVSAGDGGATRIISELGASREKVAGALGELLGVANGGLSWVVERSGAGRRCRGVLGAGWRERFSRQPSVELRRLLPRAAVRVFDSGRSLMEIDDFIAALIVLPDGVELLASLDQRPHRVPPVVTPAVDREVAQIDTGRGVLDVLLAAENCPIGNHDDPMGLSEVLLVLARDHAPTLLPYGLEAERIHGELERSRHDHGI